MSPITSYTYPLLYRRSQCKQALNSIIYYIKMLRVTSQNHTPEEVFKFYQSVGPMKILISHGSIVIEYLHIQHTYTAYMKYRRYALDGRTVQLQKAYEWYTPQEEMEKELLKKKLDDLKGEQESIKNQSRRQAIVYRAKRQMLDFMENYFDKIINETMKKEMQIKKKFPQEILAQRELGALQQKMHHGFQNAKTTFKNSVKLINNMVKNFQLTNIHEPIDIEPSIQHHQFKKKQIEFNEFKIQEGIQYINEEGHTVKRILFLNQTQFVMSQKSQGTGKGEIKFYNVDSEAWIKKHSVEFGPYGLACLNSVLLVGDSNGGLSALSLDANQEVETMPKAIHSQGAVIFDIRVSTEARRIYTAGMDFRIKCLQISEQPISDSLFYMNYTTKKDFNTQGPISAFELIRDGLIAYGSSNKLIFRQVQTDLKRVHHLESQVTRIKFLNQNCVVVSNRKGYVNIFDTRTEKIVTKFPHVGDSLCALEVSQPHTIFYGGNKTIGMLDERRSNFIKWKNDKAHEAQLSDIALAQKHLITGDRSGKLLSWKV